MLHDEYSSYVQYLPCHQPANGQRGTFEQFPKDVEEITCNGVQGSGDWSTSSAVSSFPGSNEYIACVQTDSLLSPPSSSVLDDYHKVSQGSLVPQSESLSRGLGLNHARFIYLEARCTEDG